MELYLTNSKKIFKANESWHAANYMKEGKYYLQATMLYWNSIRGYIFNWLELNKISFTSTREAIISIISNDNFTQYKQDIMFVYSIATMAEWDEYFNISLDELNNLKDICKVLKGVLLKFDYELDS